MSPSEVCRLRSRHRMDVALGRAVHAALVQHLRDDAFDAMSLSPNDRIAWLAGRLEVDELTPATLFEC